MKFAYLITLRLWKQLLRDRRTLGLLLFAPIIYIIVFGVAFGGEIEHEPIIVINEDSDARVTRIVQIPTYPFINFTYQDIPSLGTKIVNSLDESAKVDVTLSTLKYSEVEELVRDKQYRCAIWIPQNFTYNLASFTGENVSIKLFLDNSNPQEGGVIIQAFQEAFQEATGDLRENLKFDVEYAYGEDSTTLDFFAPAMIIFGVFFFSFILIMMNLIGERKGGTLPLLLQCPHDKGQIIIGYLVAFSVVSMAQTTVIIIVARALFNVSFGTTLAHYISLYIGAVILGWTGLVLAIFLSSFARSEFQAIQFVPLVILPALLLSGIVIPISQIPKIIQWVCYLLPTTYGVNLLRRISIEGYVLEIFNGELIAMLLFFVLFLIGSRFTLRET
ncbi:MAG: ABC transporter permease [Candidatus Heimdallarchaeota archaeon]|nr:MAG: ABC transporter permease [Candidatus Heimdallarchaeota archaeon]